MAKPKAYSSGTATAVPALACAIYTRKSSEEGLEQDFNSLHAQREACEAFVLSQKGLGWTPIPTAYDDGGFSGGNVERPALRRLIQDIEAGRYNVGLLNMQTDDVRNRPANNFSVVRASRDLPSRAL